MPYKDREIRLEAQRQHYICNKNIYKTRRKLKKANRKAYLEKLKLEKGCLVCGYKKCSASLVFHHINESLKTIGPSKMITDNWAFKRIDKELENCMVLCHNCHSEHHYGTLNAHDYKIPISEYITYNTFNKKQKFPKNLII